MTEKHGTRIEWTHIPGYKGETWNPITGCSPVSEGCENCYAKRVSKRFNWPWGKPVFHPERLGQPARWKKPRAIFVCSMGDLFHEDVPASVVTQVMEVTDECSQHLFLILTKRAERMRDYFRDHGFPGHADNVWLGITVENNDNRKRTEALLQIPAAKHFVSVEPMLEAVDIDDALGLTWELCGSCGRRYPDIYWVDDKQWEKVVGDEYAGLRCSDCFTREAQAIDIEPVFTMERAPLRKLDWVICGGESGPKARPMKWEWAINLLGQCESAGVPFFMKQMSQHGGADRHDIPGILQVKEFPDA